MKKKEKITKKSIDIESEFIGKPVAPKKKKEKKNDITDEIRFFLENPITLDSIKYILLRFRGPISEYYLKKSIMKIFALDRYYKNHLGKILINISHGPYGECTYYFGGFSILLLEWFQEEKCDTSPLKNDLFHRIREWLDENQDKVIILD